MLYLIRHPQPIVEPGICYGASDLAPEPKALQLLVGKIMADVPSNAMFVSSPLQRCSLVANALIRTEYITAAQVHFDDRMKEMDFGDWEMRAWDSIEKPLLEDWSADRLNFTVPGGESVAELGTRSIQALEHWQAIAIEQGRPLAVLAHAGVIQMLRSYCALGNFRDYAKAGGKIDYGSITSILWPS